MSEHPYSDVGWILNNSCNDSNYISHIPRLSSDALLYCIQHENRKSGLSRLKAEAKRRGLKFEETKEPTVKKMQTVLGLQGLVEKILEKEGLANRFKDRSVKSLSLKLAGNPDLIIERSNLMIKVGHYREEDGKMLGKPVFTFKLMEYNDNWRPQRFEDENGITDVMIPEDGRPALSMNGYHAFLEAQKEFAKQLALRDWLSTNVLIKTVDGNSLLDTAKASGNKLEVFAAQEKVPRFQGIIEKILGKHGIFDAFNSIEQYFSVYLKLHQECYLDLVIERVADDIFVGHYRNEGGDLISDPVLVFKMVKGIREWVPVRIEQIFGDSLVRFEKDGKHFVNHKMQNEFRSFSNFFAKNIRDQDWLNADVAKKELECRDNPESMNERFAPVSECKLVTEQQGQLAFGF